MYTYCPIGLLKDLYTIDYRLKCLVTVHSWPLSKIPGTPIYLLVHHAGLPRQVSRYAQVYYYYPGIDLVSQDIDRGPLFDKVCYHLGSTFLRKGTDSFFYYSMIPSHYQYYPAI